MTSAFRSPCIAGSKGRYKGPFGQRRAAGNGAIKRAGKRVKSGMIKGQLKGHVEFF
jgi:hypothetical protein